MVTDRIRRAARPLVRAHGRWRLRQLAEQLAQTKSPPATALASVLREAYEPLASPVERTRIDEVERIRAELRRSTESIDDSIGEPEAREESAEPRTAVADLVRASKSPFWARLLFRLVREWKPQASIELGTCAGLSAAYQAVGLELNGRGHLTTFEGSPGRVAVARGVLANLGIDNVEVVPGLFSHTLRQRLGEEAPVGYAFLDGHHDGRATIEYYETLRPFLADEAIIVLDDIRWSPDMAAAWTQLRSGDDITASVSLGNVGFLAVDAASRSSVAADFVVRGIS